jgi:very-short-patch-repair endonuclease
MAESPIETKMREALEDVWGAKRGTILSGYTFLDALAYQDNDYPLHIFQEVKTDRYRLDFLIRHRSASGPYAFVAVECDGHEYHDRSSADAARDKARDRFLAELGITVLRFTGSEIFRDANACAKQALDIAELRVSEIVNTAISAIAKAHS